MTTALCGVRRLGIDVGGTKCLGVVLDDEAKIAERAPPPPRRGRRRSSTPWSSWPTASPRSTRIGVGVPGLVTLDGVLRAAPNLVDIRDFRVGELLRRAWA